MDYAHGFYVPLAGVVTNLTENIASNTRYLPIDKASYQVLLDNLDDGDYTFLELRDGRACEVVKVVNFCGKIIIQRGAENTQPLPFRCGIGVAFIQTMQGVKDTVCQMTKSDCQ